MAAILFDLCRQHIELFPTATDRQFYRQRLTTPIIML